MKLLLLLKNLSALFIAAVVALMSALGINTDNARYKLVKNPVAPTGGDPYIIETDGEYYYCYSGGNSVYVNKIDSLDTITTEGGSNVYTAPENTDYSHNYWAPELHYINGEWYIYVAADDGDFDNHRMYVLKGTSQDPTEPFNMLGKITDSSDKWAIDGTVLQLNGELYFVWSGWEGDENIAQNIYIAHMSAPASIDSERVLISSPDYSWEQVGTPYVNEGPAVLVRNDRVFIVYSASGSWTNDYCLGMLTLNDNAAPLNPESWTKSETAVFTKRNRVAYGPGHCSFTTAPDGSTWMVYHANQKKDTGWSGRSVWLQPVYWDNDGAPYFGKPSNYVALPQ